MFRAVSANIETTIALRRALLRSKSALRSLPAPVASKVSLHLRHFLQYFFLASLVLFVPKAVDVRFAKNLVMNPIGGANVDFGKGNAVGG